MPNLMCGCLIYRRQPIASKPLQRATDAMGKRREGHTRRESLKLSIDHSHPLSNLPTVGWGPSVTLSYKRLTSMINLNEARNITQCSNEDNQMQNCLLLDLLNGDVLEGAWSSFHKQMRALDLSDAPVDLAVNEDRSFLNSLHTTLTPSLLLTIYQNITWPPV